MYLLECIAFQLVFLIVYDFFLKRETFFQWNRFYLIGTYMLSLALPVVKIEAFKTGIPRQYYAYPQYLWEANDSVVISAVESSQFSISWEEGVFYAGMFAAACLFGYKLWQLYLLRKTGQIDYFKDFTRVVVTNSTIAFSFFKSIFLGDKVLRNEHENIIKHELVHIKQRHSWDLLSFELMRILGWMNALVYGYQSRISELHEFIADSQIVKGNKMEHYELLLSQVFQTQRISFVNQFFTKSLIKKRIVMLQKVRSNNIWKLKYLALVPIVLGILFYTSSEAQEVVSENINAESNSENKASGLELNTKEASEPEQMLRKMKMTTLSEAKSAAIGRYKQLVAERERLLESLDESNPVIINLDEQLEGLRKTAFGSGETVPFAIVEEVPIFPGCEGEVDKRACFQENMQKHISKNFRYPQEAQEKGIEGRVAILFTISTKGSIENVELKGPDKLLENEAARIISRLPDMKPGKHKGKKVNVAFSIPITFKLQSEKSVFPLKLDAGVPPLIMLDGKAASKEVMNSLNPQDIASINVLKAEAAINIYGEKGKNEVIVVTTKKNQNDTEESNEVYKANTNTMSVTATATTKNGLKIISGTVTDGAMGLPGATIAIQGTERGVISDFDGKFEIQAKKGDVIVFRYIGLPILKFTVTDEKDYEITKIKN